MRAANLPSLRGKITNGLHLRIATAKALSEVEVYAKRSSTLPAAVAAMQAFADAIDTNLAAIKAYPASVAITPSTVTLTVAAPTVQLVVTKTPLSGATSNVAPAASGTFYASSDPTKATVSVDGLVTRVANGTTTITARNGNKSATKLVTVTA